MCAFVCERARYPARPGSAPCVSPPEAFGTSLAALALSPMAKRRRGGEGERETGSERTGDRQGEAGETSGELLFITKKD